MKYNLKAQRPRNLEDATHPQTVVKYENNIGFKVTKLDNIVYATATVELRSNKYPNFISKLFHLHNKKTLTPITQRYIVAFEGTGILLMGLTKQTVETRKDGYQDSYNFDARNQFIPKSEIKSLSVSKNKDGLTLTLQTNSLNMPFTVPMNWGTNEFQYPNARKLLKMSEP